MAAKACMSITSQTNAELKSSFKTDWKNGVITSHGQPFAAWEINAERAVITLSVIAAHKDEVKRNVESKIYELLYPHKEGQCLCALRLEKSCFFLLANPQLVVRVLLELVAFLFHSVNLLLPISLSFLVTFKHCWRLSLAKSKAALAGFRKLDSEPSPARQPVTWEEVLVAGSLLLDRQEPLSKLLAFALLVGFDLYARARARPSELLRLRAGHFTSPRRHERTHRWVAVSKTLQQNDSVVLAATQPGRLWLSKPLAQLVAKTPPKERLFPFSLAVFEKAGRSLSGKLPLPF
eukprot:2191761-Amphidinium_carterae.1